MGQTFCIRSMFTVFMVDASNMFKFQGFSNETTETSFDVELWIYKPRADGKQVIFEQNDIVNPFSFF